MFDTLHQSANGLLGPTLWLVLWTLIKIVAEQKRHSEYRV